MRQRGRRRRERPRADINITNLIDVTMTLLVVFMMIAPLLSEGLEIELASSRVVENIVTEEQAILVEVDKNGVVHINQTEVPMSVVSETIRRLREEFGKVPVQMRADKDLKWEVVAGLCGEIRAAGVEQIHQELVPITGLD